MKKNASPVSGGASGVGTFCSGSGQDLTPGTEEEDGGKWGAYESCPKGEVICGVQTRFNRADGVTGANFFCCPLPEDFDEAA